MDELKDSDLANLSVDTVAVGANLGLSALLVDPLANLSASQVVDEGPAELGEELSSLWFVEQNAAAILANLLENRNNEAQVAYVEDRQRKPDVSEVAIAVLERFATGRAFAGLAGSTELIIEGSILVRCAVVFNVIEKSVGNLRDGLVGNILV